VSKTETTNQPGHLEQAVRASARTAARTVRWHPWLTIVPLGLLAVVVLAGPHAAWAVVGAIAAVVVVWWQGHPASFERLVRQRARASWRREWVYRRRWRSAMFLSGLACRFDGDEVVPQLGRVRSTCSSDVVAVRLTAAQEPIDWETRASALAETFGAVQCHARAVRPHWIELEFMFRRDIPVVAAITPPERPGLDALPIGRRGDAKAWQLRLTGTHVLIAGATDSGKGSVIWSIIRAAAAGIRDGWVTVWAADPKGGMELGHGPRDPNTGQPTCPLFGRFERTAAAIEAMLADAVELMKVRAQRLAGLARQHEPTVADPAVVIVVDELAEICAYCPPDIRQRVHEHLELLLTQGRALSVHVVGAVQNPDLIPVKLRRGFPTRIALRTTDADQVDMVLGRGAWARGAKCDAIAKTTPGCGWVLLDGDATPTWVRASWVTNDDIDAMATTHAPTQPPATVPAVTDEVAAA
jgi:DNA segregation ATPase FtsK/SpoIIIE, S-DNA-T family